MNILSAMLCVNLPGCVCLTVRGRLYGNAAKYRMIVTEIYTVFYKYSKSRMPHTAFDLYFIVRKLCLFFRLGKQISRISAALYLFVCKIKTNTYSLLYNHDFGTLVIQADSTVKNDCCKAITPLKNRSVNVPPD